MNSNKKIIKTLLFIAGLLAGAILAVVIIVGGNLGKCKYGECIVRECVEIDPKCEADNYDPRTGQELRNCCSEYGTHFVPRKDFLLKQILQWGFVGASGAGIFLGILFIGLYNSSAEKRRLNGKNLPK